MPDHLSPEERALIDAALPYFRNRKVGSGVSGNPETTVGGWKRPKTAHSAGSRIAKRAAETKRRNLVAELHTAGVKRAEIAIEAGVSVAVIDLDLKSLRILGVIKGKQP
jgi:hypothetical protein